MAAQLSTLTKKKVDSWKILNRVEGEKYEKGELLNNGKPPKMCKETANKEDGGKQRISFSRNESMTA